MDGISKNIEFYDLVIKNGSIVDGSGKEKFQADIGIKDGLIKKIASIDEAGKENIDASGLIVSPGFVDIHTHYDGQAIGTINLHHHLFMVLPQR